MTQLNSPIPSLKLNDGISMPMLAYGTGTAWYKKTESSSLDQACVDSVKMAVGLGYMHLDGAEIYNTEAELGKAIKESGVPREKLYIVTKVHTNVRDVENGLRKSLKKLDMDYVDLYLIHSPFWAESATDLQTAWSAMESVKSFGLTRSIGVSNFLPTHLHSILSTATVPPACNQIEFHPYLQRTELLSFHREHDIATTAYAPLTPVTKARPGPLDEYLAALAKKYAVTEAEVLLRWCMEQGVVPVTTSAKEGRLTEFLRVGSFGLTPGEVKEISEIGDKKHFRGFWSAKFNENDRS